MSDFFFNTDTKSYDTEHLKNNNLEKNDKVKKMFFGDICRSFNGITPMLRDINYKIKDLKKMEVLPVANDILSNIDEKLKSGFYLEKISIDADGVEAYKEKDNVRLIFMHGILLDDGKMVEDGGDYVSIYLPLPLRFDEEWFKKYKKINLTEDTIKNCISEEYLKKV